MCVAVSLRSSSTPEPPDAVARDIERKQSPVAELEPPVHVDQHDENQDVPDQFVEERRLHDERHLPRRDAVERMRVDVSGRVSPVEDLQTPRQRGFPAVELLVEIVPEPTDGLRQDDSRGNRVAEGRQRNSATPAGDPRADAAEGYRAPDAQAAVPDSQRRARTRRRPGPSRSASRWPGDRACRRSIRTARPTARCRRSRRACRRGPPSAGRRSPARPRCRR